MPNKMASLVSILVGYAFLGLRKNLL